MDKDKRIQHLGGSIALLIVASFIAFSKSSTIGSAGMGFLGMIVFSIMSIYHLIKYLKEKKK